ncbi:hypothetical protein [Roseivirga misakiensis]|uniref:Uncharacterized protein n=1 Tax=Roseivirga misakiensis TaxID=1563681 RepID=A0A1E5T0Q9_9BACT|nr:hypothetical protein [Roseivirga misakiensis]OEK04968.1 hypothetical protein BFP71_16190 [Roseivirga misakiensis]
MRGSNKLVVAVAILLIVGSCGKKNVPQNTFFYTFKVAIKKQITEPTIISGYYGQMNLYKGDFSVKNDSTGVSEKKPVPARYSILLYEARNKGAIDSAAYTKNEKQYYNLKKLKKASIEPKFEVVPNKSGFYQIDNNGTPYLVLICLNKKTGYFPGGVGTLPGLSSELKQLEMRVDNEATF